MDYDDDYYDDDYQDDYQDEWDDDAADDWEAEAAEDEQREKEEQALKAALAEKKLATRAPVQQKVAEVEEAALPEDVQREVEHMRQVANNVGGGLVGDDDDLLANQPMESADDAKKLGALIADHLLGFADKANFNIVVTSLFEQIGKEFSSQQSINDLMTRVSVKAEEVKRDAKNKKKNAPAPKKNSSPVEKSIKGDTLNFNAVEDKGGAVVEEEENPW